jgi:hypothetical protein
MAAKWSEFLATREDRLRQEARHGTAAEKVAEGIVEDLFTSVLDWQKGDLDYQVGHADIVVTKNLMKYLVIETKRPGALAWRRPAVDAALAQARRYADAQHVSRIAVSDGNLLYAADIEGGVHRDRLCVHLDRSEPPTALWWLSVHGVYRVREGMEDRALIEQPTLAVDEAPIAIATELLHAKYKLPARCFAYVPDASDPRTWKLPHLCASGTVDASRLPKAIQSIISNYRGAKVGAIPEQALPHVLTKLARAAASVGKLRRGTTDIYAQLVQVLEQLDRTDEIDRLLHELDGVTSTEN